jgi:PST family polysaccharide transporter
VRQGERGTIPAPPSKTVSKRVPVGVPAGKSSTAGAYRTFGKHVSIDNVYALYGLFVATYALNILVLPILARRIGPVALGSLAVAQSLGFATAVLGEFGFNYYGAREVAILTRDGATVSGFVADIHTAKAGLLAIVLPAFWWCSAHTSLLRWDYRMRSATLFCIVGQSMALIWLFQGLGRIKQYAAVEVTCRALAAAAMLISVRHNSDAWLVQLWQGTGTAISTAINLYFVRRQLRFIFSPYGALRQLRLGWTSFTYRVAGAVAGQINPYVMGLSTSSGNVGLFAVSDKLVRLCLNALQPLSEATYPLLRRSSGAAQGHSTVILFAAVNVLIASVCGTLLFAFATPISILAGGDAFRLSAISLRTLAFCLPFTALNQTVGLYHFVRHNHIRAFMLYATISVTMQILLCLRFSAAAGQLGMAQAIVATQVMSSIVILLLMSLTPNRSIAPAS